MKRGTYYKEDRAMVFESEYNNIWTAYCWWKNGSKWICSASLKGLSTDSVLDMIRQLREAGGYRSRIGIDFDWRREVA